MRLQPQHQDLMLAVYLSANTDTSKTDICTKCVTSDSHYMLMREVVALLQAKKAAKQLTTV